MKRIFSALLTALLLQWSPLALAQPELITNAELAMLPAYCSDTQTFGLGGQHWGSQPYNWSPNAPKWLELMGKGFWTMHHYCWALIRLRRAERPGLAPVLQKGHRQAALGDLSFVIENSPPDFIMLPEVYTKYGEVELLLKNYAGAEEAFAKARALKPDYWPAYFQWAEYLRQRGQKGKARKLIQEGLSHAPDAKPLQQLLSVLGEDGEGRPRHADKPGPSD
jgi:tetratricopeptide (TPR) repeat protein